MDGHINYYVLLKNLFINIAMTLKWIRDNYFYQ